MKTFNHPLYQSIMYQSSYIHDGFTG